MLLPAAGLGEADLAALAPQIEAACRRQFAPPVVRYEPVSYTHLDVYKRQPMGLPELTSYKYIIRGAGQTR